MTGCVENTQSEIPLRRLTDRNDSIGRVITQTPEGSQLSSPSVDGPHGPSADGAGCGGGSGKRPLIRPPPLGTFSPREKAVIARGGAGDPEALRLAPMGCCPRLLNSGPCGAETSTRGLESWSAFGGLPTGGRF